MSLRKILLFFAESILVSLRAWRTSSLKAAKWSACSYLLLLFFTICQECNHSFYRRTLTTCVRLFFPFSPQFSKKKKNQWHQIVSGGQTITHLKMYITRVTANPYGNSNSTIGFTSVLPVIFRSENEIQLGYAFTCNVTASASKKPCLQSGVSR